jgi:ABC-type dipeptide/oligopeptide/nickel transport system permease component
MRIMEIRIHRCIFRDESLTAYVVRRLLVLPVTLFGMSVIIFFFLQLLGPEERASYYLQRPPRNEAVMEGIIKRYGLRDPIPLQYRDWLLGKTDPTTGEIVGGLLRGNLGYARFGGRPVAELIRQRFPATLELTIYSLVPILLLGVWMGVLTAVHHNRGLDQTLRVLSIIGYSLPGFVLGLLLLMLFYAELGWFPIGRVSDWVHLEELAGTYTVRTGLYTVDSLVNDRWDVWWDALRHLILPVLTLSYISVAAFLRITRSSMLETLHQDFIATARAKGLSENAVVYRHALPNALLPVVTYAGLIAAASLSGVVITETIFYFPGMGYAAAEAATQYDVVTVLGFTMLGGCILIAVNLAVDILYAFLDPRIRLS